MEFFRSFLRVIGLLEPSKVDVISELPPEVSQLILRKLDSESLLCAAQVSRKWLDVCRSDKCLRRSARSYIGGIERQRREEFLGADSPKEARTTVPQRVREVSRVHEVSRVLPRKTPFVRFGAAVASGRIQPPRILSQRTKRRNRSASWMVVLRAGSFSVFNGQKPVESHKWCGQLCRSRKNEGEVADR